MVGLSRADWRRGILGIGFRAVSCHAYRSLTLLFPLKRLIPNAYIVGLLAVIWGPETMDVVEEAPRDSLDLKTLVETPFHPVFAWLAAMSAVAIALSALTKYLLERTSKRS